MTAENDNDNIISNSSSIITLILTNQQLETLVSLAKDSLPNESCALLVGNNGGNEICVVYVLPMSNSDKSTVSFSIDPRELINAYQTAEKRGLQVVGIFHSHPTQPFPSSTDKKYMKINPIVWLIYSTLTNESKAYVFEDKIKKVHLRVIMA